VGRGNIGVLRHLSGLLQVMCAQVRGSHPGPQSMLSLCVFVSLLSCSLQISGICLDRFLARRFHCLKHLSESS
jgi:hypothetical protein